MSIQITKDTQERLIESMASTIKIFWPQIIVNSIKFESLKNEITQPNIPYDNIDLMKKSKAVIRFYNLLLMTIVDLAVILKAEMTIDIIPAKRCLLRFANVIIIESYKAFCDKGTGGTVYKELKNAFGRSFFDDFNKIKTEFDSIIKPVKDKRNIGVHYDNNLLLVYQYFSEISEESESIRINKVLKLFQEDLLPAALRYSNMLMYQRSSTVELPKANLDDFRGEDKFTLLDFTNNHIPITANGIDKISKYINQSIVIKKSFNLDNMNYIKDTGNISLLLQLISLDTMTLLNASLRSNSLIESRLLLRRINVFIYEGLLKLVGWEESDNGLLECLDINMNLEPLIKKLLDFRKEGDDINRHICTHYINKGNDNIWQMIKFINSMTIQSEVNRTEKFIRLTNEIQNAMSSNINQLFHC